MKGQPEASPAGTGGAQPDVTGDVNMKTAEGDTKVAGTQRKGYRFFLDDSTTDYLIGDKNEIGVSRDQVESEGPGQMTDIGKGRLLITTIGDTRGTNVIHRRTTTHCWEIILHRSETRSSLSNVNPDHR
jgi:hypothetical protein